MDKPITVDLPRMNDSFRQYLLSFEECKNGDILISLVKEGGTWRLSKEDALTFASGYLAGWQTHRDKGKI